MVLGSIAGTGQKLTPLVFFRGKRPVRKNLQIPRCECLPPGTPDPPVRVIFTGDGGVTAEHYGQDYLEVLANYRRRSVKPLREADFDAIKYGPLLLIHDAATVHGTQKARNPGFSKGVFAELLWGLMLLRANSPVNCSTWICSPGQK